MKHDTPAAPDANVIARYRPWLWLMGPLCFLAVCALFALAPFALGYDHIGPFIREQRFGVAWALALVTAMPFLVVMALLLLIAPLRSGRVAIRDLGDTLRFTGPWDLTVAKASIQGVEIADQKPGLLLTIDGAPRLIGVPFLDAPPVELRRRILRAIGRP